MPENEGVLVTERAGNLIKIGQDGFSIKVEGVEHYGEGGLLGMTLHPDFEKNRWLYLYYSTNSSGETKNKVVRYIFEGGVLTESQGIISDIPGAIYHDGGRIVFGVDGFLYITTGDATKENLAQDVNSLAGKILRIKDNGDIPADNPFNNAVWSYGHRNSQGLAWDNTGRLWATEHGRSGALSGFDELNLIEKGKNYGWPIIQGDETQEGMVVPVVHSGSSKTWAPGGMVFYDGRLFFTGLRGDALYEFAIDNEDVSLKEHFKEQFGRLRTVSLGPDGLLYVATSNRDGRGSPNVSDDKIIKINHSFNE